MNEISSGVEQLCQCPFPSHLIIYERLTCVGEEAGVVLFQGWINSSNATDVAGVLEEWASSEPTVVVQGRVLQVQTELPDSQTPDKQESGLSDGELGIIIVVILLVLLGSAVVIVLSIVIYKRRLNK